MGDEKKNTQKPTNNYRLSHITILILRESKLKKNKEIEDDLITSNLSDRYQTFTLITENEPFS